MHNCEIYRVNEISRRRKEASDYLPGLPRTKSGTYPTLCSREGRISTFDVLPRVLFALPLQNISFFKSAYSKSSFLLLLFFVWSGGLHLNACIGLSDQQHPIHDTDSCVTPKLSLVLCLCGRTLPGPKPCQPPISPLSLWLCLFKNITSMDSHSNLWRLAAFTHRHPLEMHAG